MSDDLIVEWPNNIPRPTLPKGYEWAMLSEAKGLNNPDGTHPWFIRVIWKMKSGKQRLLNMQKHCFPTYSNAIDFAVGEAMRHSEKQKAKI